MAEKILENLDRVLDQLIQNASALNDEETPELIEEQERLLRQLMSMDPEEKREALKNSPNLYESLEKKVRTLSSMNRSRIRGLIKS